MRCENFFLCVVLIFFAATLNARESSSARVACVSAVTNINGEVEHIDKRFIQ